MRLLSSIPDYVGLRLSGSNGLLFAGLLLLLSSGVLPTSATAQTETRRDVLTSGSGTTTSGTHTFRGSLSQTAVGRLRRQIPSTGNEEALHLAGFWYVGYRPDITTYLTIPKIGADIETMITLPIQLRVDGGTIPFTPRAFTARIRFNATLLHPLSSSPQCTYEDGYCYIDITDTARTENGTIAEMSFLTTLGNAESTPVEIVEFAWARRGEERISIVTEPGEVMLLDVCREGDSPRLIRGGTTARLAIRPNPARVTATVDFTTNEKTAAELIVVDLLGKEVLRSDRTEILPDRLYSVDLDVSRLPAGSYVVICRTDGRVLSERLIVPE